MNVYKFSWYIILVGVLFLCGAGFHYKNQHAYENKVIELRAEDAICAVEGKYCNNAANNQNSIDESRNTKVNFLWASIVTLVIGTGLNSSSKH